jgi:hypothetical protein
VLARHVDYNGVVSSRSPNCRRPFLLFTRKTAAQTAPKCYTHERDDFAALKYIQTGDLGKQRCTGVATMGQTGWQHGRTVKPGSRQL